MPALSQLELAVLRELARQDPQRFILEQQIEKATVSARNFTGVGLYTKLSIPDDVPVLETERRLIDADPPLHLLHPSLEVGANAILWVEKGLISEIEFFAYIGNWPLDETGFSVALNNSKI